MYRLWAFFGKKKEKENKRNTIYKYIHQRTMDNWVNKLWHFFFFYNRLPRKYLRHISKYSIFF